jgi:hypothetical protein
MNGFARARGSSLHPVSGRCAPARRASRAIYSGIAEFSAPVRLAEGAKVVALCRTYYRLRSSLWLEDVNLRETLLSGTRAIGEY